MPQKTDSSCKNAKCPFDAEIVSFNIGLMHTLFEHSSFYILPAYNLLEMY